MIFITLQLFNLSTDYLISGSESSEKLLIRYSLTYKNKSAL